MAGFAEYSIVVPVHNEEAVIRETNGRLKRAMESVGDILLGGRCGNGIFISL